MNRRLPEATVVLVAVLIRLGYLAQFHATPYWGHPLVDAHLYDEKAWRIVTGDWLGDAIFYQDPFYPYFLAVLYRVFGRSYGAVYLVQGALGVLLCLMVMALARRMFRHSAHAREIAWGSGLLAALATPFLFYDFLLLKTSLEVFFTVAHLLALVLLADRLAEPGRVPARRAVTAGVLLGLNLLNRGNYILLAPVFAAWLWTRARAGGRGAPRMVALYALGSLLVVLPVTVRNRIVGHEWVLLTSQGGQNFYIGNNPENAFGSYVVAPLGVRATPVFEEADFRALAEREVGHALSASETSRHFFRKAGRWIAAHPADAARLFLRKWGLWLMGRDVPDNYDFHFIGARFCPLLRLPLSTPHTFGVLGWSALLIGVLWPRRHGTLLSPRGHPHLTLGALFVCAYSLSITLFFVMDRYRLPIFPVLIVFSAGFVAWLSTEWRVAGSRMRAVGLVPVAVVGFLVFRPYLEPSWAFWRTDDHALQLVNLASACLDAGDGARGLALLREAAAERSVDAKALGEIGTLFWQRFHDAHEAAAVFARLTALAPEDASAWYGLGVMRAAEQRWVDAETALRHAKRLEPNLDGVDLHLGRVLLALGRPGDARDAYRAYVQSPGPKNGDELAEAARVLDGTP